MKTILVAAMTMLIVGTAGAQSADSNGFVAGTTPDRRPENAPAAPPFTAVGLTPEALHGISGEIPASLSFLNNQGAWYTPFTRPGMTGRYDIRGWHATR